VCGNIQGTHRQREVRQQGATDGRSAQGEGRRGGRDNELMLGHQHMQTYSQGHTYTWLDSIGVRGIFCCC